MLEQLTTILNKHSSAFQTQIPRYRQNRFVQIVVLRETKSHAIFTTEGQTLDSEHLQAGIDYKQPVDRILMYKRKQIAPERRTGKALMRDLGVLEEKNGRKEQKNGRGSKEIKPADCQIMGGSCGRCPDCILYGYAATQGAGSQKARVLTDSGFIVRDTRQVMRNIKLNAIQDTVAGGVAGSAFAARENILPQIFIPTVETLVDVTATEFIYVLGNILKTTRYGAESNREGFVRNHLLGIYSSDVELFSNLELTQHYYDVIAKQYEGSMPDYLSFNDFKDNWSKVEEAALAAVVGRKEPIDDLAGLLQGVRSLYADEQQVRVLLTSLVAEAARYVQTTKGKDQASEQNEAGEAETEE